MDYLPKDKTIIYTVLNWGLGHATRSIPLIEKLIQNNNKVIIASDGLALHYLKSYFASLPFKELPAYNMFYPFNSIVKNIIFQFYKPIKAIRKEQKVIESLALTEKADMIISDNRYGCHSKHCQNIFITHQIEPYHTNRIIRYIFKISNRNFLSPFDEIWIPDDEKINLSGSLSHDSSGKLKIKFIGIQSRMKPCTIFEENLITALLSGPEPQRSRMEEEVVKLIKKHPQFNFILVRGIQEDAKFPAHLNMKIINLAPTHQVNELLCKSKLVICRSGYSTLMDLFALHKKAILIPTPGQTEQEYLAVYNNKRWSFVNQKEINSITLNL